MFEVYFSNEQVAQPTTVIATYPKVETAIAFALELHRLSNLNHVVYVMDEAGCCVVSLSNITDK